MKKINLSKISTESRNTHTINIDNVSSLNIVKLINDEDFKAVEAVKTQLSQVSKSIDLAYKTIQNKGRVFYIGAGTSGRLGVLDASEIRPTFGVIEPLFIGIIAGGDKALRTPVENAEDSHTLAEQQLKKYKFSKKDLLIGIAASGRTPYVVHGIKFAHKIGAKTISIATSKNSEIGSISDISIEAVVGAEAITGSTRMKSGTAQKLILNMISTGTMILLGKTYSNLMVDVQSTNKKLQQRAINIVSTVTKMNDENLIHDTLVKTKWNVKTSIVVLLKDVSVSKAEEILKKNKGILRKVIGDKYVK